MELTKNKEAYLVSVHYVEHWIPYFVTDDENKAANFCEKFNRIMNDNYDRIIHYYDDDNYNKPEPRLYSLIYDESSAIYKPIEIR